MANKIFKTSKVLVMIFLLVSVVSPLLKLLSVVQTSDLIEIINSPQFSDMIFNSVFTTAISTFISVGLAWALAWCISRSNIKHKSLFTMLFTLPMLIPSISHGMGLVLLFGDNGIITNIFGININLYGYNGIIIGSILYSFPVAFLMLLDAFKYEDFTIYEAAEVFGLSKFQKFKNITLPNMQKSLISVVFAVFTLIFTDYGVPLVVGGKIMTMPVYMYREVIGLLDFSKGAIIGVVLLIPAVIAFIFDLKTSDDSSASTIMKPYVISKNKTRDKIASSFCLLMVILISLPIFTFAYLSLVKHYPTDMSISLSNLSEYFKLGIGNYLINSLSISLSTSLIGTGFIYYTAYLTSRSKKTFSNMTLHLIAMISLAIPGIVLGLSYVLFFKQSIIYGTLIILILVNMVHFFASPYLLAYNSLNVFNENFEDVSEVLGVSRFGMLRDVYIPCTIETIVEIFSYIFVNSMVTISAVSFLANFRNMPLALMVPQFDAQSLVGATAFVSIIIFVINLMLKLTIYSFKRYIKK